MVNSWIEVTQIGCYYGAGVNNIKPYRYYQYKI